IKGRTYSERLTASLASQFAHASPAQMLLGGVTAACGEEIFFRGFLQQALGLLLASAFFMLAHFGKKNIRVVSYWSIFQGFYLGLFFIFSKNLLVPMVAHGLFDIGGMIYFRGFMMRRAENQVSCQFSSRGRPAIWVSISSGICWRIQRTRFACWSIARNWRPIWPNRRASKSAV